MSGQSGRRILQKSSPNSVNVIPHHASWSLTGQSQQLLGIGISIAIMLFSPVPFFCDFLNTEIVPIGLTEALVAFHSVPWYFLHCSRKSVNVR
jgi:hypothetical protein